MQPLLIKKLEHQEHKLIQKLERNAIQSYEELELIYNLVISNSI